MSKGMTTCIDTGNFMLVIYTMYVNVNTIEIFSKHLGALRKTQLEYFVHIKLYFFFIKCYFYILQITISYS